MESPTHSDEIGISLSFGNAADTAGSESPLAAARETVKPRTQVPAPPLKRAFSGPATPRGRRLASVKYTTSGDHFAGDCFDLLYREMEEDDGFPNLVLRRKIEQQFHDIFESGNEEERPNEKEKQVKFEAVVEEGQNSNATLLASPAANTAHVIVEAEKIVQLENNMRTVMTAYTREIEKKKKIRGLVLNLQRYLDLVVKTNASQKRSIVRKWVAGRLVVIKQRVFYAWRLWIWKRTGRRDTEGGTTSVRQEEEDMDGKKESEDTDRQKIGGNSSGRESSRSAQMYANRDESDGPSSKDVLQPLSSGLSRLSLSLLSEKPAVLPPLADSLSSTARESLFADNVELALIANEIESGATSQ
uniref:Uncharacterized protein n=1 Tax=Palpitomonas bilix TaxID=652834 RepID=A0A7S3G364_9EUKA|mmetsp:Transcript_18338/g.45962  ORF Transcript_18338/g.45962 Transcript_18338/m.45962 type:complete len:359 (+) Transcript_18338:442-1518(+)